MKTNKSGLLNLLINIIMPTFILIKGSKIEAIGPTVALIIALSIPLFYGLYELIQTKKTNFLSVLGVISILLTGGIGLLHINAFWLAVKEAAIPGCIAVVMIGSSYIKKPLIKVILNQILNLEKIKKRLEERQKPELYTQACITYTYLLGASFILSAILNFIVTRAIVTSNPGTVLFVEQLGKLTMISYVVIALPCTLFLGIVCYQLIKTFTKETGLTFEEMINIK